MRLRVLFALTVVGLCMAAPALAQSPEDPAFPDLPGMGVAGRAAKGDVAPSQSTKHGDTDTGTTDGGSDEPTSDETEAAEAPDTGVITALPGTGGIPIITEERVGLAVNRDKADTMPRGLAALAAIGTIVSVGAFLVFRDRVTGR
jgi:hypothetical protein